VRPPENWAQARTALAVAAVTAGAWALAAIGGASAEAAALGGFIPARISGGQGAAALLAALATPLTATLVHAGFVHLLFNMLVHLVCGRSVEPILGRTGFLLLYIVGAYAAAAAHFALVPLETVPMIGASGAVSAVIGAYAILFGRNRVRVRNPHAAVALHVLWLAAAWVAMQLLLGYAFEEFGTRIAVAAHIGGFLAGVALARPLLLLRWRGA
jgi:membrane associated rhomboid family serine protease